MSSQGPSCSSEGVDPVEYARKLFTEAIDLLTSRRLEEARTGRVQGTHLFCLGLYRHGPSANSILVFEYGPYIEVRLRSYRRQLSVMTKKKLVTASDAETLLRVFRKIIDLGALINAYSVSVNSSGTLERTDSPSSSAKPTPASLMVKLASFESIVNTSLSAGDTLMAGSIPPQIRPFVTNPERATADDKAWGSSLFSDSSSSCGSDEEWMAFSPRELAPPGYTTPRFYPQGSNRFPTLVDYVTPYSDENSDDDWDAPKWTHPYHGRPRPSHRERCRISKSEMIWKELEAKQREGEHPGQSKRPGDESV